MSSDDDFDGSSNDEFEDSDDSDEIDVNGNTQDTSLDNYNTKCLISVIILAVHLIML